MPSIELKIIDNKDALIKLLPVIKLCQELGVYCKYEDGKLFVNGKVEHMRAY